MTARFNSKSEMEKRRAGAGLRSAAFTPFHRPRFFVHADMVDKRMVKRPEGALLVPGGINVEIRFQRSAEKSAAFNLKASTPLRSLPPFSVSFSTRCQSVSL